MKRIKSQTAWVVCLALLISSCNAVPTSPVSTRQDAIHIPLATATDEHIARENQLSATPTPDATFGLAVSLLEACSDSVNTTLRLQTSLDLAYWGLAPQQFIPPAGVSFETATVFLQNRLLFSTTSSGWRGDPTIDVWGQTARVEQTFVYPGVPVPGASLELRAEVTLLNLPQGFQPPSNQLTFLEPGILVVPVQFNVPVIMDTCR